MSLPHFLWPKPNPLRALVNSARFASISRVEARLAHMFPGGVPVLFSSGRAALYHSLLYSGLGRGDSVGVFPYASHCVLDAMARIVTPASTESDACLNVIFQQWGYIQHRNLSPLDVEDCVDSLLVPGGELFPGGGAFEIWSLPKILGTIGGGVLWCHSAKIAETIQNLRDLKTKSNLLWALRLLGMRSELFYTFWQALEPSSGCPTRLQTGEILAALGTWNNILIDRKVKLNIAWKLAPQWLEKPVDRLPCVVPVELPLNVDAGKLASWARIASGPRMIERTLDSGGFELIRVLPVPIHQDVSLRDLQLMMNLITRFKR